MGTKKIKEENKAFNKKATGRLWKVVALGTEFDDPRVAEELALGANPNADDWEKHETPLLMSILMGRLGAAKILVDGGADVEKCNDFDQRPLDLAGMAGKGKARILVSLLVEAGAQVDAVNLKGWTALMNACGVGDGEGAQALLDAGANIEHEDSKGWTPLVAAVYGSDIQSGRACLEMMVDRGAKVTERVIQSAEAWGRKDVSRWLGAVRLASGERTELESLKVPGATRGGKVRL